MKLTIVNCSPKKGTSNTGFLIDKFVEGFTETPGNECSVQRLNELPNTDEAIRLFNESETVLVGFPLYFYSMPAGIMELFEHISASSDNRQNHKIFFLVQFGFPEAIHCRPLEKYLESLSRRLGFTYLGTIIKGKCDSVSREPGKHKDTLTGIRKIGIDFGKTGKLDKKLLLKYAQPEKFGFVERFFLKRALDSINKKYWGSLLRKNGVFEESFARPYGR